MYALTKKYIEGVSSMDNVKYLLDSNIIINIWNQFPKLLEEFDKNPHLDYRISKGVATELSHKEFKIYNGIQVLTEKFIKLLDNIIEDEVINIEEILRENKNITIKYNDKTNIYFINDNKLSDNDFKLISLCYNHKELILVTEDKKIINCGKLILPAHRILNFKGFLQTLKEESTK